jgi:hypothetical protein
MRVVGADNAEPGGPGLTNRVEMIAGIDEIARRAGMGVPGFRRPDDSPVRSDEQATAFVRRRFAGVRDEIVHRVPLDEKLVGSAHTIPLR